MWRISLIILIFHGHLVVTMTTDGLETGSGELESTTTPYPGNITILVGDDAVLDDGGNGSQNALGNQHLQWQYKLEPGFSFYHNGSVRHINKVKNNIECALFCSVEVNCGGFSIQTVECVLIMSGITSESLLYENPTDSWKSWLRLSFSND